MRVETVLAIQAFEETLRAERLLERKQRKLEKAVRGLQGEEDVAEYARITEEMTQAHEVKLEAILDS